MSSHILNLYKIDNAADLKAEYRLVKIEIPCISAGADEDHPHDVLNLLQKQVQYTEKCPVALVRRGGEAYFAIPATWEISTTEYRLTPEIARLAPLAEIHEGSFASSRDEGRRVALAFLRHHLRGPLFRNNELWRAGPSTFLQKRPLNFQENARDVDVYCGFTFRLVETGGELFLAIDLRHRYSETPWLLDRRAKEKWHELRMRHVLYHFGNQWYRAQVIDVLRRSLAEVEFAHPDTGQAVSVYDYTIERAGEQAPSWVRTLERASPAISYQYPGTNVRRYGAAALSKLLLSTEDPRVARIHSRSIRDPKPRFEQISKLVDRYFANVHFGDTAVRISREPLRERRELFPVPALAFGQGRELSVRSQRKPDGVSLRDFPRARMATLLDPAAGFAVTTPLPRQFIVVPEGLPREVTENFRDRLTSTVRELLHASYQPEVVLYRDGGQRTLKAQVDSIVRSLDNAHVEGGRGLLVLPEDAKPDLHNYLKRSLKERFLFQCVLAKRLLQHYSAGLRHGSVARNWSVSPQEEGRYVSYLRYTAMGLLLVNRQWPWILREPTYYDCYIGVDVLHNTAAFTFFYEGGRLCHVQDFESKQKEKLTRGQVRSIICGNLRRDVNRLRQAPRSVVLRRDGRSFATEWHGFTDAIAELQSEGVLSSNTVTGIVDVAKTTASALRLVEDEGDLRNARIGAWWAQNDSEGIVCTTGHPFRLRGTANPLHVRVVRGQLDVEKVLADTFAMSVLSWPVPDRCMRLPIDLKLCDEWLGAVASDAGDDEALYGDEEQQRVAASAG